MTVIGCTGGIGTGKSTVAEMLAALGAAVIDADVEARRALQPGTSTHAAVLDAFGQDLADANGEIDRARLARRVFTDPVARAELEAIVHPVVEEAIHAGIASAKSQGAIVVVDLPLLVETDGRARYGLDGVLVVDAPEEVVLERLLTKRAMREEEARARIAAQAPRPARLRAADYVIVNVGSLEELAAMVRRAWQWMCGLHAAEVAGEEH